MSRRGNSDGEDRFRVRPGAPKQRGQAFVSQVLRQASKGGNSTGRKPGKTPGSRLGRGHVAARFTGQSLSATSRRATVKVRLVYLKQAGARSTITHLRYIEREGVGREQDTGKAYGPMTDEADLPAFEERGRDDRHQFRLIVSPEEAEQLDDLRTYTRHLMGRMEADLGSRLDWVAVNHWNTDNPHTHIVLRGKDDTGKDLIISQAYITRGMRERAAELSTEWLGPRTELEIQRTLMREVDQERWTSLDRALQREARDRLNHVDQPAGDPKLRQQRVLLVGRLQRLQRMGLASEQLPGVWAVHADAEPVLRAMGERGDIIRTMQRAMGGAQRDLAVFQPGEESRSVIGRVAGKGLADELYDKGYLVVDGIDGKAHYVTLPAKTELAQYPIGAVVEARGSTKVLSADKNIAVLAVDGLYRTDHHLAVAKAQATSERDLREVVDAHVRRLEAMRRAGIVERVAEGVWRVPADLPEQGRQYDAQRLGGVAVELRSHLPVERQARVIGATWLDQQLIGGSKGIGDLGFGSDVREALWQRSDFLIEHGLAEKRGQRVILARNLLATLRGREIDVAAKIIATETGLAHRPIADGERVSGIYRRNVQLASGRFAMLDDGMGFSLVPWKPVIEQRLGKTMTAVIRGSNVSWVFERQRGISMG
ncbi:MAG: type VI secretion protein [Burkholderiales bacterium RIFCSPHIGHO2_01_FULL_64_960]|nr:MAG: type VI secretion protein [Burkholderiales bacterium RIFCSPHIGHO2_01_FULL_64_960]